MLCRNIYIYVYIKTCKNMKIQDKVVKKKGKDKAFAEEHTHIYAHTHVYTKDIKHTRGGYHHQSCAGNVSEKSADRVY